MTIDFNNPAAVIAAYNAQYPVDQDQGPSGICVACDWATAMQAWSLFIAGTPIPLLSAPFAYYMASNDDTFTGGFDPLAMGAKLQERGSCTDALYPQSEWLKNWQNGGSYPESMLPGDACYADASRRLLLRFTSVRMSSTVPGAPDLAELCRLLRSGYPMVYGTYSHSMCILAVSPDNYWFYAKDSLIANQQTPNGRGIRLINRDQLMWIPFYPQEVQIPIFIPPSGGSPLSTAAEISAAITAGTWTSAEIALMQTALNAEIPINPPPPVQVPPAGSVTDAQGHVWSLGAQSQYGKLVLRDGVSWFGGQAVLIDYRNSTIKVQNSVGAWWAPTPTGWVGTTPP